MTRSDIPCPSVGAVPPTAPESGRGPRPMLPPMTDIRGIDRARVDEWLAANVPGAAAPFDYKLIAAGGSNLTFRVTDAAGNAWALRRPPVGHALPTAHDMSREWRIMAALE